MFTATAVVHNTGSEAVNGYVRLRVANDLFTDRTQLEQWAQAGTDTAVDDAWSVRDSKSRERLEAGESRAFTLEVSAKELSPGVPVAEMEWGPRGILMDFETLQGSLAAERTYVVYAPPETVKTTVNLAVTAGLTAAPGEEREKTFARLDEVVTATKEPWIGWLLDPALLQSTQSPGIDPADHLVQAVKLAAEEGKAVYSLPYQDQDQIALAQGGAGGARVLASAQELSRSSLESALDPVTELKIADDLAWTAYPVDAATLRFIAAGGASAVVLPPEQFPTTPTDSVVQAEGLRIAPSDPFLTDLLTDPTDPLAANTALAHFAFIALNSPAGQVPASVTVALPRGWVPTTGARNLLTELADCPWVKAVPLAAVLNQPVASAPALDTPLKAAGPPPEQNRALLEAADQQIAFASLTNNPQAYLARTLPPLLAPFSNATAAGAPRARAAEAALAESATAVPPVSVVAGSEVNLISDDGRVPVVVENSSNESVSGLVVKLTAQTGALRIEQPTALDLKPGQSVTARVPVHAVANGVWQVRVELLDQKGSPVAKPASLTMRVRAEWEGIGTMVVGGILALVLVFGVFSTVRKRRLAKGNPGATVEEAQ
jgi:hypothetical protein